MTVGLSPSWERDEPRFMVVRLPIRLVENSLPTALPLLVGWRWASIQLLIRARLLVKGAPLLYWAAVSIRFIHLTIVGWPAPLLKTAQWSANIHWARAQMPITFRHVTA